MIEMPKVPLAFGPESRTTAPFLHQNLEIEAADNAGNQNMQIDEGGSLSFDYEAPKLKKDTNWLGAFVIGLAGTILVTGIAPVMVTTLGASSIPITIIITLTGWLLCLFLAELSAMMPHRLTRSAFPLLPSTSTASRPGPIGSAGFPWRR